MKLQPHCAALFAAWTFFSAGSSAGQDQQMSREDYYALGEQFAHCSAHWMFASEVARRNDLDDAAAAFRGMERGWTVAGVLFLVEGLDPSRQAEAAQLFADLSAIAVEQLAAERQVARASGDQTFDTRAGDRFSTRCGHLVSLQQATIRELRSGPE